MEVGGRLSSSGGRLLKALAAARSRAEPKALQAACARARMARWAAMASMAAQKALAATLVNDGLGSLDGADAPAPTLSELWQGGPCLVLGEEDGSLTAAQRANAAWKHSYTCKAGRQVCCCRLSMVSRSCCCCTLPRAARPMNDSGATAAGQYLHSVVLTAHSIRSATPSAFHSISKVTRSVSHSISMLARSASHSICHVGPEGGFPSQVFLSAKHTTWPGSAPRAAAPARGKVNRD